MPNPRSLLWLLASTALTTLCLGGIDPDKFAGTWTTDPGDEKRGGEHELVITVDPADPTVLHMRDATPPGTVYRGRYQVSADTLTRLPNGRVEDPYRGLSWRLEGESFVLINGGVYRPESYLGTRLVKLLPDPFFDAIRTGDIAALKARADLRKDIMDSVDQIGRTALYVATLKRQPAVLETLLATDVPVDLRNRNLWGDSALFAAVRRGDPKCLAILLKNGADVNQHSDNGRTPLMAAGETCGHYGIMLEILLESGANPAAKNARGKTVREILVAAGAKNFVRIYDQQIAAYHQRRVTAK